MDIKKRCECCGDEFAAHPRLGSRQRVCGKETCRAWRAAEGKRAWGADPDNKDYFKGLGPRHRPGYWKGYRADPAHAAYVTANRAQTRERMRARRKLFATQDSIRQDPEGFLGGLGRASVFATQDSISSCLYGVIAYLGALPRPFATQDSIGGRPASGP